MMDLWLPPKPAIIIPASKELQPPSLGLTLMAGTWALRVPGSTAAGAGIAFVASGAVVNSSATINIAYYSGVAVNQIAIIGVVAFEGEYTQSIGTITGFTAFADQATNGSLSIRLFWRRMTGSESGTVACATAAEDAKGVMIGFSGCITTGDPYEGYGTNSGVGTSATSAAITTTGTGRMAVRLTGSSRFTPAAGSPPTGYDERAESAGDRPFFAVDTKSINASESATTRTIDSEGWLVGSFALIPA